MRLRLSILVLGGCLLLAVSSSKAQQVSGTAGACWRVNPDSTDDTVVCRDGAVFSSAGVLQATPQAVLDLDGDGISVTIAPSARQVQALLVALERFNQTNRRDEAPYTLDKWVRSWIVDRAQQHLGELRETERQTACEKYQTLTASEQKAITDKLGASPCEPQ